MEVFHAECLLTELRPTAHRRLDRSNFISRHLYIVRRCLVGWESVSLGE